MLVFHTIIIQYQNLHICSKFIKFKIIQLLQGLRQTMSQILFSQPSSSPILKRSKNDQEGLITTEKQIKDKKNQNKICWERKQQPLLLYILCLLSTLYTAVQISIFINLALPVNKTIIELMQPTLISGPIRIFVYLYNSYYMANLKAIIYTYLMLDVVGILGICTGILVIACQLSFNFAYNWVLGSSQIITFILIFFLYIFQTGNFRIILKTCKWGFYSVVIYKSMLYISCIFFIVYGLFFTLNELDQRGDCTVCDLKIQNRCDTMCKQATDCCFIKQNNLKQTLKTLNNFILIICGTGLGYYVELISLMSEHDGVNKMEGDYRLGRQYEEHALLLREDTKNQEKTNKDQDNKIKSIKDGSNQKSQHN